MRCSTIWQSIDKTSGPSQSPRVITRVAASRLSELAHYYPVVSVTGPRQSGKTTDCRSTFPALPYVSLEPLDVRDIALSDPQGRHRSVSDGASAFGDLPG